MALDRSEIQRRYRERKKQEQGERYMKKERERKKKYYVPAAELTEKELKKRRQATLTRVKKHLKKRKVQKSKSGVNDASTSKSTILRKTNQRLVLKFPFTQNNKSLGVKKRYRSSLRTAYRKIQDLECKNTRLIKQNKRIQKRLKRSTKGVHAKETNGTNNLSGTPRSLTRLQMSEVGLKYNSRRNQSVKKKLLFANVISDEIRINAEKRKKNKLSSNRLISGKILKKYRCTREFEKRICITRRTLKKSRLTISEKACNSTKVRYQNQVISFLQREDNCTVLPGKKDTKKVAKETHQKVILNDYMYNLYDKFRLEHPDIKISRSVFYRLRPKHVMLVSFSSRSTCLCMRHQNMSLRLRALKNIGCNVNVNPDHFLRSSMSNESEFNEMFRDLRVDRVEFTEWKKVQDNGKARCKQVQTVMTKDDFVKDFTKSTFEFREHVQRVKNQYSEMRKLRENLKDDEVLVWMDFAENFNCSSVEEVQSAYWNTEMVTLHTQVIYFPKSHSVSHLSVVGVSSVLSHNAVAVIAMLRKLLPIIKERFPQLKKVSYLTDSPTSQYRNKTIFNFLCNHQTQFNGIHAKWDYLEAGHGKGPCDGLGASVKRSADMAIKQSKATIQSAEDFFEWAQSNAATNSTVSYFYVSQDDYNSSERDLQVISEQVIPVPGTMKAHAVVPVGINRVAIRDKSCNCPECLNDVALTSCEGWSIHRVSRDTTISHEDSRLSDGNDETAEDNSDWEVVPTDVGDYIACVYDLSWYIGKVMEKDIVDGEVKVEFMEKAGKLNDTYKWPITKDDLWIPTKAVLCCIPEPQPKGKSKRIITVIENSVIEDSFQKWLKKFQ